jgi:hypothetical protein
VVRVSVKDDNLEPPKAAPERRIRK